MLHAFRRPVACEGRSVLRACLRGCPLLCSCIQYSHNVTPINGCHFHYVAPTRRIDVVPCRVGPGAGYCSRTKILVVEGDGASVQAETD